MSLGNPFNVVTPFLREAISLGKSIRDELGILKELKEELVTANELKLLELERGLGVRDTTLQGKVRQIREQRAKAAEEQA